MKKREKNPVYWVVAVILLLIVVLWAVNVVYVNVTTRDTVYRYYDVGESCDYKGCKVEITGYERMSDLDFLDRYNLPESVLDYNRDEYETFIYIVSVKITKEEEYDEENCGASAMDFTLVSTAKSTIASYSFFSAINSDMLSDTDYESLSVGDSMELEIPFSFAKEMLAKYYYEHFDEYPLYLMLPDYEGSEYIRMIRVNGQ